MLPLLLGAVAVALLGTRRSPALGKLAYANPIPGTFSQAEWDALFLLEEPEGSWQAGWGEAIVGPSTSISVGQQDDSRTSETTQTVEQGQTAEATSQADTHAESQGVLLPVGTILPGGAILPDGDRIPDDSLLTETVRAPRGTIFPGGIQWPTTATVGPSEALMATPAPAPTGTPGALLLLGGLLLVAQ